MAVKLGIVGLGTVGSGCLDLISEHVADFAEQTGVELELARVCSRRPDAALKRGLEGLFTYDSNELVTDPDIDIVVELIGGTDAAFDVIMTALQHGKHVVTANKALMALRGAEILAFAHEQNLEVLYEASVGGGIPIIGPLQHSLGANACQSVMGIVNGTTNYMLTTMAQDGLGYDEALRQAQDKGYAEADPTADVDGLDAAAKIAILASLAFDTKVTLSDVPVEGIRKLSALDLALAQDMGYTIKLVAHAHQRPEGIDLRVHPTMLPQSHPLASVDGVYNAIYVAGDFVGETMFFGQGAGAKPTASAVMGDVLEIARRVHYRMPAAPCPPPAKQRALASLDNLNSQYYLRFSVVDESGVLAATAAVFARHRVSVYSVIQKGAAKGAAVDLVYLTHVARESNVVAALQEISQLDGVLTPGTEPVMVRVQGE